MKSCCNSIEMELLQLLFLRFAGVKKCSEAACLELLRSL